LTLSRIMWREMEKQIKKLADPDMQLAGLIWSNHSKYKVHQ
jgi:hypothetical protein